MNETLDGDHAELDSVWFSFLIIGGFLIVFSSIWLFLRWWFNDRNPQNHVKRMSIPSPRKSITITLQ